VVLAGQYLERPALIPCGELVLEGLAHRGGRRPALLVCPPLGAGGGMDAPLVAELAWAAARAGHASLRFQHRGVGASQGIADPAQAPDDAAAALHHLGETTRGPLAVAGVGTGCATAAALARRAPGRLAALILVAPGMPPRLEDLGLPVLLVLAELGALPRPAGQAHLPRGARVEVVAGADATFRSGLPAAGRAVAGWLATLG
jgi:pimeloyl-ACP methyl ester carboxylesterase